MSFFNNKKPKQFNFKPVYSKNEQNIDQENEGLLSDKMYNRWNRTPYKEVVKNGNKKIKYTIALICVLIYTIITFYNYLVQRI